ncbi:toll-like receptor 6, partial [Musca vetustissima]|uniref:toll-like receptor 6 n=1 Tax=Musca vetustissima TaxID=27455 RepID=UPI002AB7E58B
MAGGFRKRGCRGNQTWCLLKDSLIFVLIMCVLMQHLLVVAKASVISASTITSTLSGPISNGSQLNEISRQLRNNLEENLLNFKIPRGSQEEGEEDIPGLVADDDEEDDENQTKEEFSIIDVNKIQIEEKIIFKTKDFSRNLNNNNNNKKHQQSQQNMVTKDQKKNKTGESQQEPLAYKAAIEQKSKLEDISNNSPVIKSTAMENGKTLAQNNNKNSSASSPPHSTVLPTLDVNNTTPNSPPKQNSPRPLGKVPSSSSTNKGADGVIFPHLYGIRENVMLPSEDPEREAQILYEKTLKEYHVKNAIHEQNQNQNKANSSATSLGKDSTASSSVSSSSSSNASHSSDSSHQQQRTLHAVCEIWTQKHCHCTGTLGRLSLSCRNIGILAVPMDLPSDTVLLDLGNNNITKLEANSFFMANNLEELTLADNNLEVLDPLAFYGLSKLKRLNLQNCGLKTLPAYAFQGLTNLVSLQLNGNALASMDRNSLQHLPKLRTLRLEGNLFYRIPTDALAGLKTLEALNLGSNLLTIINDEDFPKMPNLVVLLLKRNQIMKISSGAFANLTALEIL